VSRYEGKFKLIGFGVLLVVLVLAYSGISFSDDSKDIPEPPTPPGVEWKTQDKIEVRKTEPPSKEEILHDVKEDSHIEFSKDKDGVDCDVELWLPGKMGCDAYAHAHTIVCCSWCYLPYWSNVETELQY